MESFREVGLLLVLVVAALFSLLAAAVPWVFAAVLARWVLGGAAKDALREQARIDAARPPVPQPSVRVEVVLSSNTKADQSQARVVDARQSIATGLVHKKLIVGKRSLLP